MNLNYLDSVYISNYVYINLLTCVNYHILRAKSSKYVCKTLHIRKRIKWLHINEPDNLNGLSSLKYLDISSSNIEYVNCLRLEYIPNLEYLDCSDNYLERLNLKCLPKLKTLKCSKSDVKYLDLRYNPQLIYLDCSDNCLEKIDLRFNPKLIYLNISCNLNISNICINFEEIFGSTLNLNLRYLVCRLNDFRYINIEPLKKLKVLDCSMCDLDLLNLEHNHYLRYLDCCGNCLTELNLYSLKELEYLNLDFNSFDRNI